MKTCKAMSYIVCGIDRLGKSTLIVNIQREFGFFNIMHYQRPSLLPSLTDGNDEGAQRRALETYQKHSFASMFNLLRGDEPFIMDRGHLGEVVYAPRYRGYDGNYVFDLEHEAMENWRVTPSSVNQPFPAKLILLTTSDFSFIEDDGLSFAFDKKEEEQVDFIKAFNRSKLPKVMIDVANGKGGYKDHNVIFDEAMHG